MKHKKKVMLPIIKTLISLTAFKKKKKKVNDIETRYFWSSIGTY